MLDTNELPSSGRDAKRRKKAEKEESDKQKEADKAEAEPITPDYAAGLTSAIPPSPAPPSYAPPATPAPQTSIANESYSQMPTPSTTMTTPLQSQTPMQTQNSAAAVQQRLVLNEHRYVAQPPEPSPVKPEVKPTVAVVTTATPTPTVTPMVTHITATPQLVQQLQATPTLIQVRQQPIQQTIQLTPQIQSQPQQQTQQQLQPQPIQVQQIQQTVQPVQTVQTVQTAPQPQQPLVRRQLQLSREQMVAAQEMFNNSNRVTRPEKALILGFMAGSRENPCPQLGNVVTIKLNESEEDVRQPDQTIQRMIVETHFQMNYSTGEWRKVQKFRRLDQNVYQMQQFQTLQQTV